MKISDMKHPTAVAVMNGFIYAVQSLAKENPNQVDLLLRVITLGANFTQELTGGKAVGGEALTDLGADDRNMDMLVFSRIQKLAADEAKKDPSNA